MYVFLTESKPQTCRRQINRDNHPAESISQYCSLYITVPLLDYLNNELEHCFNEPSVTPYLGMSVVPSKLISMIHDPGKESRAEKFLSKLCRCN